MRTYHQLMAERIGWGALDAGLTGGSEPYVVDNLDDGGQGSLRYGLGLGGRMVTRDPGLAGVIHMPRALEVAADTIVCLGPEILLQHVGDLHHGFLLRGPNIGITYCNANGGWANWTIDAEGSDAVHIDPEATDRIWIHRNTLKCWADGAVDTTTHAAVTLDRLTISWNSIAQIGQPLNLWARRASVGFNRIADLDVRAPKMTGGSAHAFNNVIKRWRGAGVRQTHLGGQIQSDFDMFIPSSQTAIGVFDGPINHTNHKSFGRPVSFVSGPSNVDAAFVEASRACSGIMIPSTSASWNALRDMVEAAGV